ncbi:MAG: NAD+ synthase [Halieaceae bacterium]|jgi:NAD+ synthase (glutamine-hydrolysing)|nr:NAD+ synthase [Halieaceae bacterium]
MSAIDIIMAQVNTHVGDFDGNLALIQHTLAEAGDTDVPTLIVFPELTLCGYPPEDLLLRPSMQRRVEAALQTLCRWESDSYLVLGYPRVIDGNTYNMAGVIHRGELIAEYAKQCLPNYQVFDEKRYFVAGQTPCVFEVAGLPVALTICEDIWEPGPAAQARAAGAGLILNLNSSPFHRGKQAERESTVARRAQDNAVPIVYVNQLGGQDELVFDGGSFAVDAAGDIVARSPACESDAQRLRVSVQAGRVTGISGRTSEPPSLLESIYQALVLGVRDYVNKNGFKGVVLGLSGGIDSALTLAVAADALGADRVEAVMMPFRYTSSMSVEDAAAQSRALGVPHKVISIEPMYEAFMAGLQEEFAGLGPDTTEENLQARCRGVLLMSISNKKGYLVLTTGNKSEIAVGYSTLYGDMAGGFDVLKDVPKTLVYELSRYRNTIAPVIPERVITRPPSAELRPDQTDQDSLPDYAVLDRILELYIEQDCSADEIVASGHDADDVRRVLRLVDLNEYKRRQAPVGVRITRRGFGRDRRYPITSAWKIGN